MPTAADLFIAPSDGATLAAEASIRLRSYDDDGTISDYSLSLGGQSLPSPVLASTVYSLLLDTRNYFNGTFVLRADATHSVTGDVFEEIDVTLNNELETNTDYHVVYYENTRTSDWIKSVNAGVRCRDLPDSNYLPRAVRARLFSDNTPGADDVPGIDPEDLTALKAAFDAGQPVVLSPRVVRSDYFWRAATEENLSFAGDTVSFMLRLDPEYFLSYWRTGYQRIVKIRRATGTPEVWWALAVNIDGSGAGLFRYQVSGDAANPVQTFTQSINLTTYAPDAIDFAVVGTKAYVVRDGEARLMVYDTDSGQVTLELGIPAEAKNPLLVENCAGKPILLCVNGTDTTAYDLSFESPLLLWTQAHVASRMRFVKDKLGIVYDANKLYVSSNGTGTPTLGLTMADTITALGNAGDNSLEGLTDGGVYNGSGILLTTLDGPVRAVGSWYPAGDYLAGVAGTNSNEIIEQAQSGDWMAGGLTLAAPFDPDSTAPDTNLAEGKTVTGTVASGTLSQLTDGNTASGGVVMAEFQSVMIDFGLSITISRIEVDHLVAGSSNFSVADFAISESTDFSGEQTEIASAVHVGPTAGTPSVVDAFTATGRYLRLYISDATTTAAIYEIRVYNDALDPNDIVRVLALEGLRRVMAEATGTIGQPDFVPAVTDDRLLIGTGDDGIFAVLQRSNALAAEGAFSAFEVDKLYLQPLFSPRTDS